MIETLIVPGLDGSGPGHWQRIWAEGDPRAELVEQEHWDAPVLSEWLHRLEARILEAPNAILVAHSLGSVLVAQLAHRPAASHVAGALLVAPADLPRLARRRPDLADFVPGHRERLPFPTILVASRNDPFMSFREAEAHARDWGSALVDLGHAGHVNPESGYGAWPEAQVLAEGLRHGRRPSAEDPRARAALRDAGLRFDPHPWPGPEARFAAN